MSSREQILGRVREALVDVGDADPAVDVPIEWTYGEPTPLTDVVERFVETVTEYRAAVVRCSADEVGDKIVKALAYFDVGLAVMPVGVPPLWRDTVEAASIVTTDDAEPLTRDELNETGAVVTAAALGIAETGTIVLDHRPDQGRRALTLLPDVHVCVVRADQVVSDVPEAVAALQQSVLAGQPLTWISGPSATSDIELNRVEGVHGPRNLHVILVD